MKIGDKTNKRTLGILTFVVVAIFFGFYFSSHAHAASSVYYSVGQNISSHETGSGTVTVSGTTATFSVAQIASNMGVGDVIDYDTDNKKCYISGKTSTTVWSCTNATGGVPTAATGAIVNSINHAFSSLSGALPSGAGGAKTLLGNSDLTAIDVQLNISCYYDTGPDTTTVIISGWTTDSTRFIKIYTPTNMISEVNHNQRSSGKWDNGKYRMEITNNDAIGVGEDFVWVDGLQINIVTTTTFHYGISMYPDIGSEIRISNCIIKGALSGSADNNFGIYAYWYASGSRVAKLWNNIVYNFTNGAYTGNAAFYIRSSWVVYAHNNTVFNNYLGYNISATSFISKNNLAYGNTDNYYGTFDGNSTNNLSGPGADAGIPLANARNGVAVSFVSTIAGSEDFHLLSTDVGAKNYGANLSSDPNLPFSTDIDGQGRTVDAWDIGADEYSPSGNFTLSVWVKPSTSIASKAIVGKSEELRMVTNESGQPLCQIKSDGVWQTAATSSEALTVWEWSQVVCAYDRTTMRVFVDGLVKGEQALTVAPDDTSSVFEIGHDASSGSGYGYYSGLVDNYRFFTYAMGTDDAKREFNNGKSMRLGSSGSTSGTGAPTNAASGEYCVPGDTTSCAPPVLEMKMDEKVAGDAKTLNDTSGNGNNGTSNDGANNTGMDCSKPGKIGSACQFDGVDDYASMSDSTSLHLSNFTISLWLKADVWISSTFISKRNTFSGRDWTFSYIGGGTNELQLTVGESGGDSVFENLNYNPSGGQWHHIVAVKNGTTYELFADGVSKGTDTSAVTWTDSDGIKIGSSDGTQSFFKGMIDQVRIYNYARTPAQVAWEYNKGKPVAEWKFNECSGSTVHDESGNANDGTITLGSSGQTTTGTCTASDNTPWYNGRNGKFGSSLNLDGQDDYVNIGNNSLFGFTNDFTIAAWIKRLDLDTFVIADRGMVGSDGYVFGIEYYCGADQIGLVKYGINSYCFDSFPADTNWHHVAVTVSSVSGVTMYVDGKNIGNNANTSNLGTNSRNLYLGLDEFLGGNSTGQIDDVRIYNYSLTDDQIQQVVNEGSSIKF